VEPSPVDLAARALARRDRCEADLRRILERKGVSADDAADAVAALRDRGVVDDRRFAAAAARSFAGRGYGDRAIVFRLQREGVDREFALEAVAALELEADRAARCVARRGQSERTVRWLAARGFARDSIEHGLASIADTGTAELG
jgi:SOS response regulatory protein OraA/RecX